MGNELSERLYTLEVQKADVDQELRRLQSQVTELETQLGAARQWAEKLQAQIEKTRKASIAGSDKPASDPGKSEFFIGADPSATSDTRSGQRESRGDCGGFMTTANCGLRSSPKGVPAGLTTQERRDRHGSVSNNRSKDDERSKHKHHKDEAWRREGRASHRHSKSLEPGRDRHQDKDKNDKGATNK